MLPTSTNVTVDVKAKATARGDAVAVFVTEGSTDAGESGAMLSDAERQAVARLLAAGVSRGKAREVHFDILDGQAGRARPAGRASTAGYRRVLVAGIGPADKVSNEAVRQAAGALAKACRRQRLRDIAVVLPTLHRGGDASPSTGPAATAEAIATGLLLASFRYDEYKGTAANQKAKKDDDEKGPRAFTIVLSEEDLPEARQGVERARAIAEGQNFARTIASRPGNDINPPTLAKVAQELAREVGLTIRVLDEKQMRKLGMGGILAVGAGSNATPPRMIVLEWNGGGAGKKSRIEDRGSRMAKGKPSRSSILHPQSSPLLVVGKAITFDTGGISIKPADKMGRMIYDKCGGMTVLGLMAAVARLKLPIPVVGILASAENHISDTAYRPGDILRMYNGVTVEVTNTDAEGRLVLGDALAWGIETYKPQAVVDLATLTGGVVVALGKTMAGVMSNSDELVKELTDAGAEAGEKLWRLPLGDDQRDYIKSDHADIVNSGGREGHPLQGGAFLSFFVPWDGKALLPWAHLDIAGVADTEKELPYYAKGATGWGVRTLLEWVEGRIRPRVPHATPRAAGG
jgi:leucyl aminopeptidase